MAKKTENKDLQKAQEPATSLCERFTNKVIKAYSDIAKGVSITQYEKAFSYCVIETPLAISEYALITLFVKRSHKLVAGSCAFCKSLFSVFFAISFTS